MIEQASLWEHFLWVGVGFLGVLLGIIVVVVSVRAIEREGSSAGDTPSRAG